MLPAKKDCNIEDGVPEAMFITVFRAGLSHGLNRKTCLIMIKLCMANSYLIGSAQVAPRALDCPLKTQISTECKAPEALRCNGSYNSKANASASYLDPYKMCLLCYKGVAGAVEAITTKSCTISMPYREDWEVSARIAFQTK